MKFQVTFKRALGDRVSIITNQNEIVEGRITAIEYLTRCRANNTLEVTEIYEVAYLRPNASDRDYSRKRPEYIYDTKEEAAKVFLESQGIKI